MLEKDKENKKEEITAYICTQPGVNSNISTKSRKSKRKKK